MERIYVDMDGVLVDLIEHWLKEYNKDFDQDIKPDDVTDFGIHNIVPIGHTIYKYLQLPTFFGPERKPYESAIEKFTQIADEYSDVYILTTPHAKSHTCMNDKKLWVKHHLPEFNVKNIIFTHHKHLLARKGDILIDDKPSTLDAWKKQGGTAICMNRPWNKDYECAHRVSGWYEFYYLLEQIKNG